MTAINIKDEIYWVGVKDPSLEVFDVVMKTSNGTTYNSYLINDEEIAIIDCVKDGFFDESLKRIKSIIGDKKVSYLVIQHTELDHTGSVQKLLDEYPDIEIIATSAGLNYLKDILNHDINGKDSLKLKEICTGKYTLNFISTPNIHWPDTMFTYVKETKTLFTCDFGGAHFCPKDGIVEEKQDEYLDEFYYYYKVIMAPFKKFVNAAISKIKNLDIENLLPSHGPIHLGEELWNVIDIYKELSIEEEKKEQVLILYVSAYGNTEKMAKYFFEKLNDNNIQTELFEITSQDKEILLDKINKSKGLLIGSPTINQDAVHPVWDVLTSIEVIPNRGKVSGAFGSYGWSGEAVPMITQRLKTMKFKTIDEGYRFKFVPDNREFQVANEFIEKFIDIL